MTVQEKVSPTADEQVTTQQLLKMVKALSDQNKALEAKVGEQATRSEGQVDYYMCNACGARLPNGERCKKHPNDAVHGVGVVFNPRTNSVRIGAVSTS